MSNITKIITEALKEDNAWKDITTRPLVPEGQMSTADLLAKADGVVCGLELFKKVFTLLDRRCRIVTQVKDGDTVRKGQTILTVTGPTWALLSGERTALNFLQHLSGVATLTHRFVRETRGTGAKILDTRKTIPGLRGLQKYAVRCGGGYNHRMSLSDMALIKDNHLRLSDSLGAAVARIKKARPSLEVEVECETLSQLSEALDSGADIIMLDNMGPASLKKSVALIKAHKGKRPQTEISGGITLKTVRKFALLGVDRISVGALTHSANALDMSLEVR